MLVDADGTALAEGRNRVVETGDATQHPELELARWAAAHLTPEQRAGATVYTSGEHCAMCAAAHGWVGLGRIVYASSSAQLRQWLAEVGAAAPPVLALPVQPVAPGVVVQGPVDDLAEQVRELQLERSHGAGGDAGRLAPVRRLTQPWSSMSRPSRSRRVRWPSWRSWWQLAQRGRGRAGGCGR